MVDLRSRDGRLREGALIENDRDGEAEGRRGDVAFEFCARRRGNDKRTYGNEAVKRYQLVSRQVDAAGSAWASIDVLPDQSIGKPS